MSYTVYKEFARELVTTGELDPMYTMLYRSRAAKGDSWTMKFCLYMLMFYDSTRAAWIADQPSDLFWGYVMGNFDNHRRGKERRHFRGENGRVSAASLAALGGPEKAFQIASQASTLPEFYNALDRATVVGFGPYFRLKWADYLTNVFEFPISVEHLPFMLPDPPLKCIKSVFPTMYVKDAMDLIVSWIADMDDPFSGKRKCGYSEAETVACGIHTYLIKHEYQMGDDIAKYKRDLAHRPDLVGLLP